MKYTIFTKNKNLHTQYIDKFKNKFDGIFSDKEFELVVCFGGDGTLLKAFDTYKETKKYLLINTGNIGFLSAIDIKDIDNLSINNQKFTEYRLIKANENIYAINDIQLMSETSTSIYKITTNKSFIETVKGSGLNFSTTLGSTGLNSSLNGALIVDNIDIIQYSKINQTKQKKYTSIENSIIFNDSNKITVTSDNYFLVIKDGIKLDKTNKIDITLSNKTIKLSSKNRNIGIIETF